MITRVTILVENTLIGGEYDAPARLAAPVNGAHFSVTIALISPHVKFPRRDEHDH